MSDASGAKRWAADVDLLRCLDPACGGTLAYEATSGNVLAPDPH